MHARNVSSSSRNATSTPSRRSRPTRRCATRRRNSLGEDACGRGRPERLAQQHLGAATAIAPRSPELQPRPLVARGGTVTLADGTVRPHRRWRRRCPCCSTCRPRRRRPAPAAVFRHLEGATAAAASATSCSCSAAVRNPVGADPDAPMLLARLIEDPQGLSPSMPEAPAIADTMNYVAGASGRCRVSSVPTALARCSGAREGRSCIIQRSSTSVFVDLPIGAAALRPKKPGQIRRTCAAKASTAR